MRKFIKSSVFFLYLMSFFLLIASSSRAVAQTNNIEMADAMRANGKIYVVVAVMLIILVGIVVYLIRLERKLMQLENNK
jgi:preprotein translocase subunit YajC